MVKMYLLRKLMLQVAASLAWCLCWQQLGRVHRACTSVVQNPAGGSACSAMSVEDMQQQEGRSGSSYMFERQLASACLGWQVWSYTSGMTSEALACLFRQYSSFSSYKLICSDNIAAHLREVTTAVHFCLQNGRGAPVHRLRRTLLKSMVASKLRLAALEMLSGSSNTFYFHRL